MRLRALAGTEGRALVVCPSCGEELTVDVGRSPRSMTPVRARVVCSCGQRLVVFVERRAAVRKEVDLPGSYRQGGDGEVRSMRIRNLSRSGLLFTVPEAEAPVEGDTLVVEFTLSHAERHHFVKEAVVRRSNDGAVGAEFLPSAGGESYDRVYDLALALFKQPSD